MTPLISRIGAVVLILAGIAIAVAVRMRCSRDRRRIGAELTTHRCRLTAVRVDMSRFHLCGSASYEVEYRDDEDDPAQADCTVRRGIVSWPENRFDRSPLRGEALPNFGRNWRG